MKMIVFLSEIHFWTTQEDIFIKDSDYGSYKYFQKKDTGVTPNAQAKKMFCDLSGIIYAPNNKRPEKLKDKLKELEEHLVHNKIVFYCWDNNKLKLLLSTGLIVYLTINPRTGDLLSVGFDKHFFVKLQANIISDGTLFGNQIICVCNDGHVLGFGGSWKEGWVLDGGPRRRLHYHNEWLVVYGKAGVEHPQPWSPLTKDHQRANLHLYWIGPRDPELLAHRKTDGEPLLVIVSKICSRTVIVVEQKVTQKGAVSVEVSNFELISNSLKRISVTSVPLQTQVSCTALNDSEERLLIGCIDGSLAILDRNRGSTRIVKAAFIATFAAWHPEGVIVAVANEKGYVQYYDTALNCIKNQLASEDCTPTTLLDLSGYFNSQFNVVSISWGPKDLIISFDQGPLAIITHIEGSLSFKGIAQRYIKSDKIDKAVKLLLSWDFNEKAFYVLQQITVQLLRQPLTEVVAQHLQDALGCFHSSPVPISSQIRHKFGHQVMSVTRRFFYQLLRASMFEMAFLLAVDVGHHDLFMDLYYIAVKLGETLMAAAARAQASALLSRCSSEASNCSRSSCSQCSDSESCSSTENFEENFSNQTQEALSSHNVLTTDFMQPTPTTSKIEEIETRRSDLSRKIFPSRATYVKAPQVPSNFMKLNQTTAPVLPSLAFYRTMGPSYIQQYVDNVSIQNKPISNNTPANIEINDYIPELPPYPVHRPLCQIKDTKNNYATNNKESPPLPVICTASTLGLSKNCQIPNSSSNQLKTSLPSFNTPVDLSSVPNLISFDNNHMTFENVKPSASSQLPLSKKNNTKVKFSDTVTAFIVPEVKRSVKPSLPSHITDPQRELAESLPLCHPNEEYLKDFTPINKENEKELEEANQQPKIKVVHFGVV